MTVARVQAQKPSRGAITHTVEADGRLEAANQLAVTAPEALVKSVAVAEGDRVKTGDLLFTFDTAELEKQLAQKRLELQKLQLGLQEQQEKDALAETEGETKRERAEEDLKLAQEKADLNVRQTAEEMRRARKELRDYNGSVEDDADYDEDEYDDFYEDNKDGSVGIAPPIRDRFSRRESSSNERAERYSERPRIKRHDSDKVVNIHTTTQLQVVLVKPEKFDEAAAIADNLNEKRTVVLNLESTNRDVARRLLDFLSGVAYASNGQIKRVANSTYIITPYNVDVMGDLIDELENNGMFM